MFTFTAPGGTTAVNIQAWGAGGGMGCGPAEGFGGGGGYAEGTLAVTGGQVLHGLVGYGGGDPEAVSDSPGTGVYANAPGEGHQFHLPGSGGHGGAGGGLSGVWTSNVDYLNKCGVFSQDAEGTIRAGSNEARTDFSPIVPATAVIAGAGGGARGWDGGDAFWSFFLIRRCTPTLSSAGVLGASWVSAATTSTC